MHIGPTITLPSQPGEQPGLKPLPYHRALVDYLRSEERDLWNWFSSTQAKADYTQTLRMALLKNTYRLDAEHHPEVVGGAEEAKSRLGLNVPVTLYQAQQSGQLNAALYYIQGEGHVVLSGPLLSLLTSEEMKSVISHELAHYVLWQLDQGDFLVADRLVQAIADDPRAKPSHVQSARKYRLYTEIFADRGSLAVINDLHTVIAGLVKIETGLSQVSGLGYLKQADEVFAQSTVRTEGLSHPETFIRARALRLWADRIADADQQVISMIEGPDALEGLDLIGQARLTGFVRRFLGQLLRPQWFQTEASLAHAKMFFPDFKPAAVEDAGLTESLTVQDQKLREFFCYLLLDFAVADPELGDLPLAAGLQWSQRLGMESLFEGIVVKELKVKSSPLKKLKQECEQRLKQADLAK